MSAPRTWGDGGNDAREHVIEDISYTHGWVQCRCGAMVTSRDGNAALKQAWDWHRGLTHVSIEHFDPETMADDIEVEEFFATHLDRSSVTPTSVTRQTAQGVHDE